MSIHRKPFVPPEGPVRVRFPRDREVLGIIEQLHGFAKMKVKCADGVTRVCRVPGKLTRSLWVRERDIVLVKPWEISTEKGDVIYKYRRNQVEILQSKGLLKDLEGEM